MRIWIDKLDRQTEQVSGKALFCHRLADELRRRGVYVTADANKNVDLSLNVIRLKHERSSVKVLRLDGVWHDTAKDWQTKNLRMAQSVKDADGIVYQSEFAKTMSDKYLGIPDAPVRVIFNGSNVTAWDRVAPLTLERKRSFIAFSKWRPHKRLRAIIDSFLDARVPDSQLLVVGDTSRSGCGPSIEYMRSHVRFVGQLSHVNLMPLVKACNASVHLCWFDACPNSVVEAICARVPVICNNVGGTPEIVALSGGCVCEVDKAYDYEPVDLYHPPPIDRAVVAQAMQDVVERPPNVRRDHVDIRNVADQYLEFFESLL